MYINFSIFLPLIALIGIIWCNGITKKNYKTDTLILSHILLRHGDGTPTAGLLWKNNPYYNESFYKPYGYGQLTNDGKNRVYNVGLALRQRYDSFLGDLWEPKVLDAWSTHYNATKTSLSLFLAGLYPPTGELIWNTDLLWQPIPYNYKEEADDRELSSWACNTVASLLNDSSVVEKLKQYDGLMETLTKGTGEPIDYLSALYIYLGMEMQTELGFPLENWTQAVYPEPLKTYMVDFYYIETSTKELKTVIAGYFLKKILIDTKRKIDETLVPSDRKLFIYSGHETNLGTVIGALEIFNMTNIPDYGSYLLFEVHNIDDVYGFKIFYQNNEQDDPILLTLPGCEEFCPLDDFVKLTADIIPKSEAECSGNDYV